MHILWTDGTRLMGDTLIHLDSMENEITVRPNDKHNDTKVSASYLGELDNSEREEREKCDAIWQRGSDEEDERRAHGINWSYGLKTICCVYVNSGRDGFVHSLVNGRRLMRWPSTDNGVHTVGPGQHRYTGYTSISLSPFAFISQTIRTINEMDKMHQIGMLLSLSVGPATLPLSLSHLQRNENHNLFGDGIGSVSLFSAFRLSQWTKDSWIGKYISRSSFSEGCPRTRFDFIRIIRDAEMKRWERLIGITC